MEVSCRGVRVLEESRPLFVNRESRRPVSRIPRGPTLLARTGISRIFEVSTSGGLPD